MSPQKSLVYLVLVGVLMTWAAPTATAETFSITGPTDTQFTMISSADHNNWGGAEFANAMPVESGVDNILIRFNLPAAGTIGLVNPSQIFSATLNIHRNDWISTEGILRLYRLNESWVEGTGTGSSQDGSADWYDRAHGTSSWSTPGAVGGSSSEGSPTATYTVAGEYAISLDVTSDIRYWYEHGGDTANLGWVMTCQDSDGVYSYGIRFDSDDYLSSSSRPSLSFTVVPEPSAIALLATGTASALFMAWRRRKRS